MAFIIGTSTANTQILAAGTTAERPATPSAGQLRYNSTTSSFEVYAGTSWSGFGSSLGTQGNPATSAAAIKAANPSATDGVYWIKPTGGSGTAFQTYCIMSRDGGGWMKILQYYGGTNMNNSSAINASGTWINAEINGAAGKLSNTDILALQSTGTNTSFLFRVTGGSDNLLNNGVGTGKFTVASGTLGNWGTAIDPTTTHTLSLDMTSDGTYEYSCTYTNDTRSLCGPDNYWSGVGGGAIWYIDHNYNGTFSASPPNSSGVPICYGFDATGFGTNLHWMSGLSTGSGASIGWGGTSNSSSAAIFIK